LAYYITSHKIVSSKPELEPKEKYNCKETTVIAYTPEVEPVILQHHASLQLGLWKGNHMLFT